MAPEGDADAVGEELAGGLDADDDEVGQRVAGPEFQAVNEGLRNPGGHVSGREGTL
jgi:hypothetical protein